MVGEFRKGDDTTPVIVMGYYNPVYIYGVGHFLQEAKAAGTDGLLVVDLPPEMDEERCIPARQAGISFIRLATPTTYDRRLPRVLQNISGFVYYVSMTGIIGQVLTDLTEVSISVKRIKAHMALPVAVGFGIKTGAQVKKVAEAADGIVVGTAIVNAIASTLDSQGQIKEDPTKAVSDLVYELRSGL